MFRDVVSLTSVSRWGQGASREPVKEVLKVRLRGWERVKREDFGRARVTERGGEGDWEPPFFNAYHHVPGISVGVRGSRMNSVERRENLTRTDWFDLRALLFGVFSLLLFKVTEGEGGKEHMLLFTKGRLKK